MPEPDEAELAEVARATAAAVAGYGRRVAGLLAREVTVASPDQRVLVRVNGAGRVIDLELRDGALRRYDAGALGELVARTLREGQRRARDQYERAASAIDLPELATNEAVKQRVWRD